MTSDPMTVSARIFVGSINVSMTREMLQEYFSQYGRVVGEFHPSFTSFKLMLS